MTQISPPTNPRADVPEPPLNDETRRQNTRFGALSLGRMDDEGFTMIETGPIFRPHAIDEIGAAGVEMIPGWTGNAVLVTSPELTKELYQLPKGTIDLEISKHFLRYAMGSRSPFLLSGRDHIKVRQALVSELSVSQVERYRAISVQVLDEMIDALPLNTPVDLHAFYARFAQQMILRVTFGLEPGRELDRMAKQLFATTESIMRPTLDNFLSFYLMSKVYPPEWDRVPFVLRQKSDKPKLMWRGALLQRWANLVLRRKIRQLRKHPNDSIASRLIARAQNEPAWTDKTILDTLKTLMLAGQETSISAYVWAAEYLMHNDGPRETLVAEARAGRTDRYAQAVNNEALRMRSPVWGLQSIAAQDFELGGYRILKGTWIFVVTTALHYQPGPFPEPHDFKPERFLDTVPERYSFTAFGEGAHRCPGTAFFYTEAAIVLHRIFGRLDMRPVREGFPETRMRMIYFNHPQFDTEVIIDRRRTAEEVPIFTPAAAERDGYVKLRDALLPDGEQSPESVGRPGGGCPFGYTEAPGRPTDG